MKLLSSIMEKRSPRGRRHRYRMTRRSSKPISEEKPFMLELKGVNAFYGNIQALKNVSLTIPHGSMVTIIGANGAGKTTLLKSISGLIQSKSGSITYEGTEISSLPPVKIVSLGISQVPEGRQLFTHLTVLDNNLHLGAYLYYSNRTRAEIEKRLEWIYEIFPHLKIRTKQLAGT